MRAIHYPSHLILSERTNRMREGTKSTKREFDRRPGVFRYLITIGITLLGMLAVPSPAGAVPAGIYAYVCNSSNNSVSVINAATNTVTTTIPVGTAPSIV